MLEEAKLAPGKVDAIQGSTGSVGPVTDYGTSPTSPIDDIALRMEAARAWCAWEAELLTLRPRARSIGSATQSEIALAQARGDEGERCGEPRDAQGQVIDFWIVGMGKLGARELNVSSDIDLIYVYDDDGATDGARQVSAHEYFAAVARRLYALIGETTDDGFVFRVDLALRPNGNSGPPAVSLGMLEEYFQVQGREWERFAWLKSRVVAPRAAVTSSTELVVTVERICRWLPTFAARAW